MISNKRFKNKNGVSKNIKSHLLKILMVLFSFIQGYWPSLAFGATAVAAATMFGDKAYLKDFNKEMAQVLDGNNPRETIKYIEKKLSEYYQWKKENYEKANRMGAFEAGLCFQLAKAKEAAGLPVKEIAAAYKKALSFDHMSSSDKLYAVVWLKDNSSYSEYTNIISKVVHDSGYLWQISEEAKKMINDHKPDKAIDFLEEKLGEYAIWRKSNLGYIALQSDRTIPRLYFQLARAKEMTGVSEEEMITLYKNIINSKGGLDQNQQVEVLIKLFENLSGQEQKEIFQAFVQKNSNSVGTLAKYLVPIFEEKKNWAAFKLFLDSLFEETKEGSLLAEQIDENLKSELWKDEFRQYCKNDSKLSGYVFGKDFDIAKKYIANEEFEKAADIYGRILRKCGPEQDKSLIKFKFCQALFWDGQYENAASELEKFIEDFKSTHRDLTKQAVLMKGRSYIQLGRINKATDTFLALMMEYPEAQQAAESNFFMGYCYMLQGKFEAAREAFELILKDYPGDSYAAKAKVCLRRIESMAE